eukprot:2808187-Amphidinium_carterae.1
MFFQLIQEAMKNAKDSFGMSYFRSSSLFTASESALYRLQMGFIDDLAHDLVRCCMDLQCSLQHLSACFNRCGYFMESRVVMIPEPTTCGVPIYVSGVLPEFHENPMQFLGFSQRPRYEK